MIDKISYSPLNIMSSIQPKDNSGEGAADLGKRFGSFLNDAISNLNTQQQQVDNLNQSFIKGELSDVHQLTIASEKASLGLELTVQVRNKVLEAYQEMMRMQL
ncbi:MULTISPECIES: flagellar hook-basal body complex protein FliE [unclassified Paenibacillus]|uniref:flagellar hook-basal body complex protein FliE n=1 Tax=unclassified Paenibacillus TaxID=185978 RepID=UPI000709ACF8|nr:MULTISPECIES: flagellar hook-basal body complex protein FliE [unclassified Paenibacillus]KQX69194.1 flagellar hook-basal body protein FliE [Paenibacillus sp. Root444D2]KRE51740.1 flagellar hook-basal body protein FliE [Paenibacillus sp. Soil724D2]